MLADVERLAQERAGRDGTGLTVTAESVSAAVHFDADLARRLAAGTDPAGDPDDGRARRRRAVAAAGVPTAMLFVRNPTGVSHSPDEPRRPPTAWPASTRWPTR